MTDRVPGAPGQFQAVVTAEEQQKLLSAEPFVITLTRDDHPVIQGTPYSKAAVLPDALAQTLCPYIDDPTPADAFRSLADRMLESAEYPGCYYRIVGDEKEWFNPPMVKGTSYRTTQRFCGQPVYVKLMNLGAAPTGTEASPGVRYIATGVSAHNIISWDATARVRITHPDGTTNDGGILRSFPVLPEDTALGHCNLEFRTANVILRSTMAQPDILDVNLLLRYIDGQVMESGAE